MAGACEYLSGGGVRDWRSDSAAVSRAASSDVITGR